MTSPFPSMGWLEWAPDPKYIPVQPTKPVEDGQPLLGFRVQRYPLPTKACQFRAKHPLLLLTQACPLTPPPCPMPELLLHPTDPSSPPLSSPSALWGLVPALCSPVLPATGLPCGFSSLEILPFSELRVLPGQGPMAGLCPGHWKVWDAVQTQPPRWAGGFMALLVVAFIVSGHWLCSVGGYLGGGLG